MLRIVEPKKNQASSDYSIHQPDENVVFVTTRGIVKNRNEDCVGLSKSDLMIRVCVADGHWGDEAARESVDYWLNASEYKDEKSVKHLFSKLEGLIYERFQAKVLDNESQTPETSVVAVTLSNGLVRIANYGDCRLLIVRDGRVVYDMPTHETWLGVFSRQSRRGRLPVLKGANYYELGVEKGDNICVFSDGISECVYGQPTLSSFEIAALISDDLVMSVEAIMRRVYTEGAEDNATLCIIRT